MSLPFQMLFSMQIRGLVKRPEMNGMTVERDVKEQIRIDVEQECLRIPVCTINGQRCTVKLVNIRNITSKILIECTIFLAHKVREEEHRFDDAMKYTILKEEDTSKIRSWHTENYGLIGRLIHFSLPIFKSSGWIGRQCAEIVSPLEQRILGLLYRNYRETMKLGGKVGNNILCHFTSANVSFVSL